MPKVTVIGGGVGGMVCALLLARRGHRVRLYERLPRLGGKLAEHSRDGFTFSLGPSLLTLPGLFADLGLELDLVELDELCRYRFADGSTLTAYRDPALMAAEVDRLAPGEGRNWLAFHGWARGCFEASRRTFLTGPLTYPPAEGRLPDLLAVAPGRTLDGLGRRFFSDPRLRRYVNRYATYAGSDPYRAPAALGCIPAIEHGEGGWYVPGGLPRIADALALMLEQAGVEIVLGTEVTEVLADGGRVSGVRLASGERERADVVVANTDAAALYGRLLPDRRRLRRIAGLGTSSSVFLLLAGVDGRTEGLSHHSIVFSADYQREFADIFHRRRPAGGSDRLHRLLGGGRPVTGAAGCGELGHAGQRPGPRPQPVADVPRGVPGPGAGASGPPGTRPVGAAALRRPVHPRRPARPVRRVGRLDLRRRLLGPARGPAPSRQPGAAARPVPGGRLGASRWRAAAGGDGCPHRRLARRGGLPVTGGVR